MIKDRMVMWDQMVPREVVDNKVNQVIPVHLDHQASQAAEVYQDPWVTPDRVDRRVSQEFPGLKETKVFKACRVPQGYLVRKEIREIKEYRDHLEIRGHQEMLVKRDYLVSKGPKEQLDPLGLLVIQVSVDQLDH